MDNNYVNNREAWQEMQKESDKYVFDDKANGKIKHLGFNNISDFDIAIKELKSDLSNFDILLEKQQDKIDEIDMKLRNKNPEHDKVGAIPKLNKALEEALVYADELIAKKQKEESNLADLEAARKEFLNNKKLTFREEIKENKSGLQQHERALRELKDLENKMYAGTMNNFEKERYEVLKKEIIPALSFENIKVKSENDGVVNSVPVVEEAVKEKAEFDINNPSDPIGVGENNVSDEQVLSKLDISQTPEKREVNVSTPTNNDMYEDGKEIGILRKAVKAISSIPSILKAKIDNMKALKSTGVSSNTSVINMNNDGLSYMNEDAIYGPLDGPQMTDEEILAKMNIRK